jgi:hypothetical protein
MTMRRETEQVDDTGRRTTVVEETAPDSAGGYRGLAFLSAWVGSINLWILMALLVVESILAFRLGFQLAGANPANDFVEFIYDLSGPLIQPFEGIAAIRDVEGDGFFEPATVIAMAVFAVAALLLMGVIAALRASIFPPDAERSSAAHRHTY